MPPTRSLTPPGRLRRPVLPNLYDPLKLFGDGPPTWTINKGNLGERPSPSAAEAMKKRDDTALKLRWHANHAANTTANPPPMSLAASALADKLDACAPPKRPCLSGGCPVCMRAQQKWLVMDTMLVLRPLVRNPNYLPQVLSLVPEFGRVPVGSLNAFDIDKFLDDIRDALRACGIQHFKLGLDISLNQRAGVASPGFWQAQLWGFFHEPKRGWRTQLKAAQNPNGGVGSQARRGRDPRLAGSCCRVRRERHIRTSRQLPKTEPESRGSRGVLEHSRPDPAR